MTEATERKVGHFQAKDDDGNLYIVIEWLLFTTHQPPGGSSQEVNSKMRLALASGERVNSLKDGTFQIVDNDVIIRKVE